MKLYDDYNQILNFEIIYHKIKKKKKNKKNNNK